eukprot:gene9193-10153_t
MRMPSLSPTMTAGTIAKWIAKPGDVLHPGDVVCEVETDKAAVAFEMQDTCVLAKILVDVQSREVNVGEPIAFTVEDQAGYEAFLKVDPKDYPVTSVAGTPAAPTTPAPASPTPASAPVTQAPHPQGPVSLSPAARNLVQRDALDVSKVNGTGKRGMISKSDVITAKKAGLVSSLPKTESPVAHTETAAPVAAAPSTIPAASAVPQGVISTDPVNSRYKDIPNSNMRKVIAKRLTESKATVPHFYVATDCLVDPVMALRASLKREFEVNISVNDVVIKAAALALRDMPEVNARWLANNESVQANGSVDISVAVATPTGLITPILTQADRRSLLEINSMVKELATRARIGKLKPEEYQGGTFSISNLGMYGIDQFSAVINPPQACILAVGSGVKKVVPPKQADGEPEVATVMTVQLSADRRVVDEALAAQFLQLFRAYFNNPNALLL